MKRKTVYWFYFHTKEGELEKIVSPIKIMDYDAIALVRALREAGFKDAWMEELA